MFCSRSRYRTSLHKLKKLQTLNALVWFSFQTNKRDYILLRTAKTLLDEFALYNKNGTPPKNKQNENVLQQKKMKTLAV